jgi:hypothetical protein
MNERDIKQNERFIRVVAFKDDNAAVISTSERAIECFADIAAAIAALETESANQLKGSTDSKKENSTKNTAREHLREYLQTISRTANAVDYELPNFSKEFVFPKNRTDQELLTSARVTLPKVVANKQTFIKYGLDAEIISELEAEINAFEATLSKSASAAGMKVTATSEINEAVKKGSIGLRVADAIIKNLFRDNPSKLAAWTAASHLERAAKRKKEPPKA